MQEIKYESIFDYVSAEGAARIFDTERCHKILEAVCLSVETYQKVLQGIFSLYADIRITPRLLRDGLRFQFIAYGDNVLMHVTVVESLPTHTQPMQFRTLGAAGGELNNIPAVNKSYGIFHSPFGSSAPENSFHYGTAPSYQKVNDLGTLLLIVSTSAERKITNFGFSGKQAVEEQ